MRCLKEWIIPFSMIVLILLSGAVALAQDQNASDDPTVSPKKQYAADRYVRYAKGLMTQYDSDSDGYLDADEFRKMRRPPNVIDQDSDGKFSFEELLATLAGNTREQQPETINKLNREQRTRVENYVDSLMKQYDIDSNGSIDGVELKKMRRQPDNQYDRDSDGQFSRSELIGAITGSTEKSLEQLKEPAEEQHSAASQGTRDESTQRTRSRLESYVRGLLDSYDLNKDDLLDQNERSKMRRPIAQKADANRNGKLSVDELIAYFQESLATSRSRTRQTNSSTAGKQSSKSPTATAFVEFELLELSPDASPEELKNLVSNINAAESDVGSLIADIIKHESVTKRSTMSFGVVSGRRVEMRSDGRLAIPTDYGGRSSSNSYTLENVGLRLDVEPEIVGDWAYLQITVSKSGIEKKVIKKTSFDMGVKGPVRVTNDEEGNMIVLAGDKDDVKQVEAWISQTIPSIPTLKTFEFESTLVCRDGRASAALFFESDRRWLVIVHAIVN